MPQVGIHEAGPERLSDIKPLWEELNRHHAQVSTNFSSYFEQFSFEERAKALEIKSIRGQLRLFFAESEGCLIGQCVVSLMPEGLGEIDSIYVSESHRGQKVGDLLMQAALKWLDANGAKKKSVVVIDGNDAALSFYAKYGFLPRSLCLMQK